MNSSSLKPLQMIGVSPPLVMARTASKFRLGAGLDAEVERLAEVEELLDDVALLIDFDRINAAISALIAGLGDRFAEGVGDLGDAMAQNVREADQDRDVVVLFAQFFDEELEVDGLFGLLVRVNGDVTEAVDSEVSFAPVLDAVGFGGVRELPVSGDVRIGAGVARASCPSKSSSSPMGNGPTPRRPDARLFERLHHTSRCSVCNRCAGAGGK